MQRVLPLQSRREAQSIFGSQDRHLRSVRDTFGVKIVARDAYVRIEGDDSAVESALRALQALQGMARGGKLIRDEDAASAIASVGIASRKDLGTPIEVMRGRLVTPKTPGQARYIEKIKRFDLVFCIGPAGTGKTYLAVAMAVSALKKQLVERIVLARPAVEAGEHLGFLPGGVHAKVNPYLRPLYDALRVMMDQSQVGKFLENDMIEIVPLAYMRGRTLDDAFIILDEAQNCTVKQMKTFLTRLGQRSRIVVTGDITQIDLESPERSGLVDVQAVLGAVSDIAFVHLGMQDIVRHRLVQDIVDAYEGRVGWARGADREQGLSGLAADPDALADGEDKPGGQGMERSSPHGGDTGPDVGA